MAVINGIRTTGKSELNNNQITPQSTDVPVNISNSIGFTIDYSAQREYDTLSPLLKQSIMNNIGTINNSVNVIKKQIIGGQEKILLAGFFTNYGGVVGRNLLVRLNSDGTVDETFCQNASDGGKFTSGRSIRSMEVDLNNKILIGGSFIDYGGVTDRNRFIRLNEDGTVDNAFCVAASDGNKFDNLLVFPGGGIPLSIAIKSNGQILVGGLFVNYGSTLSSVNITNIQAAPVYEPTIALSGSQIVTNGDLLTISGTVTSPNINGVERQVSVTRSQNTITSCDITNPTNPIITCVSHGLSSGQYIRISGSNSTPSIDGYWLVNSTTSDTFTITTPSLSVGSTSGVVITTKLLSTNISSITTQTGSASYKLGYNYFITLNNDGTLDGIFSGLNEQFSESFLPYVSSIYVESNSKYILGTNFIDIGYQTGWNYLYKLSTSPFPPDPFNSNAAFNGKFNKSNGFISDIKADASGLYICGFFNDYGGVSGRNNLIKLNFNGTTNETFCQNASDGAKFSNTAQTISIQQDGKILVGGFFIDYGGVSGRNILIRLNTSGELDEIFCQSVSDGAKFGFSGNLVRSIYSNNLYDIFVGGFFSDYNSTTYDHFAVLSPQLYPTVPYQKTGTGRVHGYILESGITESLAYPEIGSSGVTLQVNETTGNVEYTSDNSVGFPDYQFNNGKIEISIQNL